MDCSKSVFIHFDCSNVGIDQIDVQALEWCLEDGLVPASLCQTKEYY